MMLPSWIWAGGYVWDLWILGKKMREGTRAYGSGPLLASMSSRYSVAVTYMVTLVPLFILSVVA